MIKNKSGKFIVYGIIILIAIAGLIFFINKSTGNIIQNSNSEAQQITISMGNSGYTPNTITVKAGQPVEVSLDSSVRGCYRQLAIPSLGINKYSTSQTDTIKFTPTEKGTYQYQCGMGMARGTLIVN